MILAKRPEIDRFLNDPPRSIRAVLIHGRDRGGVRERADVVAGKVAKVPDDPFDVALLTELDLDDKGRLEGELTALSMTGGRRLIRLRLTEGKAGPEAQAAEALKIHAEGGFNPDAVLLIEAGALDKRSALRKAAEAAPQAAAIAVYEDEVGDIARLVREALAAERLSLATDALELFVARLPKERGVARQEIERLILYLGPGSGVQGSVADLAGHLGVEPEASLSDVAQDAFGGRAAQAQAGLRRARAEGEGGPAAVRAMGMYLAKLRRALALVANGAGAQEAAKASGVFWKSEREFLRQMRAWKTADLDQLQPDLLEADRLCKSTGYPDGLIAERQALAIAARARRLGL